MPAGQIVAALNTDTWVIQSKLQTEAHANPSDNPELCRSGRVSNITERDTPAQASAQPPLNRRRKTAARRAAKELGEPVPAEPVQQVAEGLTSSSVLLYTIAAPNITPACQHLSIVMTLSMLQCTDLRQPEALCTDRLNMELQEISPQHRYHAELAQLHELHQ